MVGEWFVGPGRILSARRHYMHLAHPDGFILGLSDAFPGRARIGIRSGR